MRLVLLSIGLLLFSFVSYLCGRFLVSDAPVSKTVVAVVDAPSTATPEVPGAFPEQLKVALSETFRDENGRRVLSTRSYCRTEKTGMFCGAVKPERTNVLIIGDSFGWDGVNAVTSGFPDANLIINHQGGCPLVPDVTQVTHSFEDCALVNQRRYAETEAILPEVDYVVVSIKITTERISGVQETLKWLDERGADIIVFGNPPMFKGRKLPEIILAHGQLSGLNAYAAEWVVDTKMIDQIMAAYVQDLGHTYIARNDYFCPEQGGCDVLIDGIHPITMDSAHQSRAAAEAFGGYVAKTYPDLLGAP